MPGVRELSIHYLTTEYNLNMKHHEKQPWDGDAEGGGQGCQIGLVIYAL